MGIGEEDIEYAKQKVEKLPHGGCEKGHHKILGIKTDKSLSLHIRIFNE